MDSASPQLEDGFTRIANSLYEALCQFSGPSSVLRITMAVIRETYGYNRKTSRIPTHRLSAITGWSGRRVRQVLEEAVAWGMVVTEGKEIGPQKDFTRWGKPEGRTSAFRKATLPLWRPEAEGYPSENGKATLPMCKDDEHAEPEGYPSEKSEGYPSPNIKDKKDKRQQPPKRPDQIIAERIWSAYGLEPPVAAGVFAAVNQWIAIDQNEPPLKQYVQWLEEKQPRLPEKANAERSIPTKTRTAQRQPWDWGWRKQSGANGPSVERLRGWPARLVGEDLLFKPTAEELRAMVESPDFGKFQLDRYMAALTVDRIREAREEWVKEQSQ